MAACQHPIAGRESPCPHPAVGESGLCLWHNRLVAKQDPYVAELLTEAAARADGDLAEAHLAGLRLGGRPELADVLTGCNLRRADLRDADLEGCDLSGADLSQAVLRRARLRGADLSQAVLTECDLSGCDLTGAKLHGTMLRGAILDGTVLSGADLAGADLAGAEVRSFAWNRRTRFAGVHGFEPRDRGEDDSTQSFLAPLALGQGAAEISSLAEAGPDDDRTRWFRPVPAELAAPAFPPLPPEPAVAPVATPTAITERRESPNPAGPGRPPRWATWTAAASLLLAAGGAALAGWGLVRAQRAETALAAAPGNVRELTASRVQHEADLAELARRQEAVAAGERALAQARSDLQTLRQELAVRRGEVASMRTALRAAENEALRLRAADDRAAVLGVRLDEANRLAAELARANSRQEQVGQILAAGVDRLREENAVVARQLDDKLLEKRRSDLLETELARLRQEGAELRRDRDRLAAQARESGKDLVEARAAMERYLARINASNLQAFLADDQREAPLLALSPGKPVALGGDYLVSLQVDPGEPGRFSTRLVVQRPAAAANPDIAVVLYDRDERPLRRLSFSFPHVDAGSPFVASTATITCDRFPAMARVLVAPGVQITAGR